MTTGLVMALAFMRLFTTASLFPPQDNPRLIKRAERYINYAIFSQFIVSLVGAMLLTRFGHPDMGFHLVVLSVGLYLLTIAPLLRVTHYYIVGTLLCLIPLLTCLFVPVHLLGALSNSQVAIDGIASGITFLILSLTNMILTLRIRRGQYKRQDKEQSKAEYRSKVHHTGLLVA